MTVEQKIDSMILSLEAAKEEIKYAELYIEKKKRDKDFYKYGHPGYDERSPNGTFIRESLKNVGRLANIVAKEITLSCYCNELYK